MSGWFAGAGFRDQFTPEQEDEMERRQAWEEERCRCGLGEPGEQEDGTSPTCPVHGDPEVLGT